MSLPWNRKRETGATECSIFERALDALPDGVLLVNADRRLVYTNPAFKQLWSLSEEDLASGDEGRTLQLVMEQLVDPEEFRHKVEQLHATAETSEDEIIFRDGRIISRRSLPFEEEGRFRARIWIFTDVTEARNATLDQLTGLANRLAFSREFPPFVTAPPDGLVRSVAILDVDHFKRYNDIYGHAAGDDVLSQIGIILKSHQQKTGDLIFRIGGEEFLMGARTRNSAEARKLFERVRAAVSELNCKHTGNPPHEVVTVSIGFASFQSSSETSALFQRVDAALYQAKGAGRNQVVEVAP